jgi:hypothetical protein
MEESQQAESRAAKLEAETVELKKALKVYEDKKKADIKKSLGLAEDSSSTEFVSDELLETEDKKKSVTSSGSYLQVTQKVLEESNQRLEENIKELQKELEAARHEKGELDKQKLDMEIQRNEAIQLLEQEKVKFATERDLERSDTQKQIEVLREQLQTVGAQLKDQIIAREQEVLQLKSQLDESSKTWEEEKRNLTSELEGNTFVIQLFTN